MRKLLLLVVLIAVTACSGDDRGTTQTVPARPNATTTSAPAPTTTSMTITSTTTTVVSKDSRDPGTESVGVTDKVTIIILDPED